MNTAVNSLDVGQYTLDEIRKYEAIYGRNFVSPGGEATTSGLLTLVALRPNMFVLDVGRGLGVPPLYWQPPLACVCMGLISRQYAATCSGTLPTSPANPR